jgi:hypothetical protein
MGCTTGHAWATGLLVERFTLRIADRKYRPYKDTP